MLYIGGSDLRQVALHRVTLTFVRSHSASMSHIMVVPKHGNTVICRLNVRVQGWGLRLAQLPQASIVFNRLLAKVLPNLSL